MTRPQDAATEALADAIASRNPVNGLPLRRFDKRNGTDIYRYVEEARDLMKRLKRRGYVIRKARKSG